MFTWYYECCVVIQAPLKVVWDLCANPSNWLHWSDPERIESFRLEGEFKPGSKVRAKLKNKSIQLPILIAEVIPYREYKTVFSTVIFKQESACCMEAISPDQTKIVLKVSCISVLVPFMKSYLTKRVEPVSLKSVENLARFVENAHHPVDSKVLLS